MSKTEKQKKRNDAGPSGVEVSGVARPYPFFNRELSWIDFNARVLEVAERSDLPLLERVKFLAIFFSNLDEFMMVRVANIIAKYSADVPMDTPDGLRATAVLAAIRAKLLSLLARAGVLWKDRLLPGLQEQGIRFKRYSRLTNGQKQLLHDYFIKDVRPLLTPQAVDRTHPFPCITGCNVNFILQIKTRGEAVQFARVELPPVLPRLLFVPQDAKVAKPYDSLGTPMPDVDEDIVFADDVLTAFMGELFPGFSIVSVGKFRITRNTRLELDEDDADDLMQSVKDLVDRRRFGDVIRLEVEKDINHELATFLIERLGVRSFQVYRDKVPMGFAGMMCMYGLNRPKLKDRQYAAPLPAVFAEENLFEAIAAKDVLVYHPYESFDAVLAFLRRAVDDPDVVAVKQTIYRVGSKSPIVDELIRAQRMGKQVTAVVELKARFDEVRNIAWAEELEEEGVHVVYGLPELKIHAKLCLVIRREGKTLKRYLHIGTGNYNASTAKLYTDLGLFTTDEDICEDATNVFNVMTGYSEHREYRRLLIAPVGIREGIVRLIDEEIAYHRRFGDGAIDLKCNQLTDEGIIKALYRASTVGVRIRLQVRGACCLVPGVQGVSDMISLTSIVGKYLEHSRIYRFHAHGENRIYIGSADLMTRNLDRRIEVLTPLLDKDVAAQVGAILDMHLADTAQSWRLNPDGTYHRSEPQKGKVAVDSQARMEAFALTKARTEADAVARQKNGKGHGFPKSKKGRVRRSGYQESRPKGLITRTVKAKADMAGKHVPFRKPKPVDLLPRARCRAEGKTCKSCDRRCSHGNAVLRQLKKQGDNHA